MTNRVRGMVLCICFGIAIVAGLGPVNHRTNPKPETSAMMRQLIEDSKAGKWLSNSSALEEHRVMESDLPMFKEYITKHPDYTSFHMLIALRRNLPNAYGELPSEVRASILVSGLKRALFLNEWGDLNGSCEYYGKSEPAKALLDMGKSAIPYLARLLDDLSEVYLEGSEEATYSEDCKYRHADYACQFLSLILNVPYQFSESSVERDKGIVRLKKNLADQQKR